MRQVDKRTKQGSHEWGGRKIGRNERINRRERREWDFKRDLIEAVLYLHERGEKSLELRQLSGSTSGRQLL